MVKLLILAAIGACGLAVLRFTPVGEMLEKDRLSLLLGELRQNWWSPLALLGLYAALLPLGLPATPLLLAGGLIFGTFWGWILNFTGCFVGAGLSYFLGRALGRDFIAQLFGERLKRFERVLNRSGLWAMVRVRFLPLPFPVVNYGAALAGVRPGIFLISTAIGLFPATLSFTYFASALANAAEHNRGAVAGQLALSAAGLLLLSLIPTVIVRWRRIRRFRDLQARRAGRTREPRPPA